MLVDHHLHFERELGPPPAVTAGLLPKNQFGALTGNLDHLTLSAHDGNKPDDNHVYIWLSVPAGPVSGKYECAFNTESASGGPASQYLVKEEAIQLSNFPNYGFSSAKVSYDGLGLKQSQFATIQNGALRSAVYSWAGSASIISAYGITYSGGDGLHDIHMNSGEKAGSGHPNLVNQDGVLVFYYRPAGGQPFRRWVFIKFASQKLKKA